MRNDHVLPRESIYQTLSFIRARYHPTSPTDRRVEILVDFFDSF